MKIFPEFTRLLNHQLLLQERSATWLARRLQLHPGTVNRWLNQELRPASPELVARIADLLCIYNTAERQRFLLAAGYGYVDNHDNGSVRQAASVNPHNLPAQPTALIGRERDVQTVCALLTNHTGRLLTLLGPPGIGKTRLGLAVAARLHAIYQDGAYFVPLAAISDPVLVPSALLAAVGIIDPNPKPSPKPPWTRLLEFLRDKELLLLLDNFEQITGAAPLVAELLATCPRVRILVTSRERLHLRAEQRFQVPFLEVAPAVVLFTQRAQAIAPAFAVTPENQPILTEICQRLDCLPLALELSAVQVDLFSPADLLAALQDHSLDLLANGPRDLPTHHRTLRHAIARSYALLPEPEQALFRTLGVFVGGFDRTAVTYFGFGEKQLQSLINKSLVQMVTQQEREHRFILLETIHDYANELLSAMRESQAVQQCHARYFLELAESAYQHREHSASYEQLEREHDNLRAALTWSLNENPTIALQISGALQEFWCVRGYYTEGAKWLAQALSQNATLPSPARGRALHAAGRIALTLAEYGQATLLFDEALQIYMHLENEQEIATSFFYLGMVARDQNDLSRAKPFFEQSLILQRRIGDTDGMIGTLGNLASIATGQDDLLQAKLLLEEGLAIARTVRNERRTGTLLARLADYELRQNAPNAALAYLRESLLMALSTGYRGALMAGLERIAEIIGSYSERQEDQEKAVHLLGAADALRKQLNTPLSPAYQILYQRTVSPLRSQLDEAHFAKAWAEGQAMPLEEAVKYALTDDFGVPPVKM